MNWVKQGLIFRPDKSLWWSQSHAMIPSPFKLNNNLYRIYYSGRNSQNQSHIGWFECELDLTVKITNRSQEPILKPGRLGCFDDNGVTPSCVIRLPNGDIALYYIGWNPGSTVRMHLFGGLAISKDEGKTFTRWSEAPILERTKTDPYLNTAPWVVKCNDGFRMYYVSGHEWVNKDLPRYNIKTAFSKNGIDFERAGDVCIDFKDAKENALARPYVIYDNGLWKMWFSYKGEAYQIGYATSIDGIHWHRSTGSPELSTSANCFDSAMVEYAAVTKHKEYYYMFYNGNNYGYDGIGLAISSIQ